MDLPVINKQLPEKQELRDDGHLWIVGRPWFTIQGEGPYAGTPAVFLRLADCNLQCPGCFSANTVIRMADFTTRLIPEIRVGDRVLSYSRKKERFVKRKVTAVMQHQVRSILRLRTESNKKTFVTEDHPFLVRGKGWVLAKNLKVGDKIVHLSLSELRRLHNPMRNPESLEQMLQTKEDLYGSRGGPGMSDEAKTRVAKANSVRMTNNNPMKNPEVAIKGFLNRKDRGKKTSVERFVEKIGKKCGLRFVGDGTLVVGNKVPDFVIEGTNKLVEVWDVTQTEFLGRTKEWRSNRKEIFEAEGYEVLFLPVFPYPPGNEVGTRKNFRRIARRKEIRRVRRLLAEYSRNGETVKEVTRIEKGYSKSWIALTGRGDADLTVYNFEVEGTHTYIADTMIVHNCDTDYTTNKRLVGPESLMEEVLKVYPHNPNSSRYPLLVLTGGEPFRQNFSTFVRKYAVYSGFKVQIETNGTLWFDDYYPSRTEIICSPKAPQINEHLKRYIRALKYIVRFGEVDPTDGLPTSVLDNKLRPCRPWPSFNGDVYVQPMDEDAPWETEQSLGTGRNIGVAVESCMKFGYKLSLQLHKLVGLE